MDRNVARVGAWAGWIAVIGIMAYHLALTVLAGQRVSGISDLAVIRAYYGHSIVGILGVEQIVVLIPVAVFGVALRETLASSGWTKLLAGIAVVAITAELATVVTEIAAQSALVVAVGAGEPVAGLFRFWDVAYNSGAYAFEATWVLGFGLALRGHPGFPRLLSWLTPVTALLLAINIFAIWVGIPDAATLAGNMLLGVWFAGASVGLGRLASARMVTATAAA
jgi:hypothetical protein